MISTTGSTRQRHPSPLSQLTSELQALRAAMLALEARHAEALARVAPGNLPGARNLLHYIALRQRDMRPLQETLATLGLSSIGRSEAHALSSVDAVLELLARARRRRAPAEGAQPPPPCDLHSAAQRLDANTVALFGPELPGRTVRVMVTMPSEAAGDYSVIHGLLDAGMDCMRINCAHDDTAAWKRMIGNLEQARVATGRHCTVLMDLAGPKLRTGEIEPGPAVIKIRPTRDDFGRVTAPAAVWLTAAGNPSPAPSGAAAGELQVAQAWLADVKVGDVLAFRDARDRHRVLTVADRDQGGLWAELHRTAYVINGTRIARAVPGHARPAWTTVSGIPARRGEIRLAAGDLLLLTRDPVPGRGPSFDSHGGLLSPPRVSCTLPEVFADVQAGERVCLDDGKITGVVESASATELRVRIDRTPPRGGRLAADKGINLPDSQLRLPALTERDREHLRFVTAHADLVGMSFVNREQDVLELIEALRDLDGPSPGIVLKIETQRAFARLPALLLTALQHDRVGVMIARGDLAIEVGYQRLAEVQEEILWLCEAAHCPAIWATQVLETLAKEGAPSRAEITDAAMGSRAECVMLNKGPHILDALRVLDDILRRMETHQTKKRAMLRALHVALDFDTAAPVRSLLAAGLVHTRHR